jgi:hypothetical protein
MNNTAVEKKPAQGGFFSTGGGAGSRNRTGTIFQSADFESAASTNFATPAGCSVTSPKLWHSVGHDFENDLSND